MLQFEKEQKVYDIAGVKVGGQPGENPTAMIGSIFYKGDKTVRDEKAGTFDRDRAEELIARLEEISDRTGLPAMLDVVCSDPQVAEKYLEFAANATRMPILIDAVSEEAGLKGIDCARELGIVERTIFNSLNPETKQQIYDKIKDIGLKSAIALTYSTRAIISSKERVKLLDILIPRAEAAGIRNILVDTVVMDIATLGLACKAIYETKKKFGYPAGCGAHNAVESWRALKKKKDKTLTLVCSSIVNGLPIAIGADFVLYGPINAAEYMFPAISLIDASYGQVLMEEGKRPSPNHPRFKIARLY
ncbi:MAG: tetrahydromethanopterin S-methyltransferase subunit H [Candidatus Bathyarchaeota archaeon]|nr:tetrahydromethanopterin S-methyltransferase subunit H [Candidatus Bathyarchaeota archaeon]MDH5687946.1 tetrahydromethanopterin S-methyltransferase subunit H [Candidatus Bathyarchaeota archaeon]